MKLVQMLKLCVCGAFIASILTGAIFMIRSSADERGGKQMKSQHPEDNKAQFPEEEPKRRLEQPEKPEPVEVEERRDRPIPPPPKHPKDIGGRDKSDKTMTTTTNAPVTTTTTTTEIPTTTKIAAQKTVSSSIEPKVLKQLKSATSGTPPSIHIFYYPWYGNPEHNGGKYYHWNHRYLTNWKPEEDKKEKEYPKGSHTPPGDIASVYYPSLGPYSSWDPKVIERHMKWMASAGIDVVVCSWYPKGKVDPEGTPWDGLVPALLNATEKAKMKMTFHLEPYEGRTVASIRQDIAYLIDQYGDHPALYRHDQQHRYDQKPVNDQQPKQDEKSKQDISTKNNNVGKQRLLPLFYVYDSYRIQPDQWSAMLHANGTQTIRGTRLNSLLIGLYVDKGDEHKLVDSGFDGLYTYFAADGFSHGSTATNWPDLSAFCARNQLLFVPSVGPGYNDTRVRPWNTANVRDRQKGDYYREHFKMAHTAKADIVSITSFNEWHEGTQIEPAIPYDAAAREKGNSNSTAIFDAQKIWQYAKYDGGPEQYLEITLEMIKQYFTPHNDNLPAKIARIV